jgi:hypothetical protein
VTDCKRRPVAGGTVVVAVLGLVTGLLSSGAGMAAAAPTPTLANAAPGTYRAVSGQRILDTVNGVGGPVQAVPAESAITLQVTGRGGVPASGVAAVALNVTASGATSAGYVTVYPAGSTRPTASSLNVGTGVTIANLVVAKVSSTGAVSLFNGSHGTMHLVADVQGYYLSGPATAAGSYTTLAPSRLLDTRVGTGAPRHVVAAHGTIAVKVLGHGGVPASGVSAVALNVTVTGSTSSGYVTAYPAGTTRPTASNLNHTTGQTLPVLVFVKVGTGGVVDLYNGSPGTVQLIADVEGYYHSGTATSAGAYTPGSPRRLLDTRLTGPELSPGFKVPLAIPSSAGSPGSVSAAVLSVTVTQPKAAGHLSVFPAGYEQPATSTVSFAAGQTVADLVVVPVDSTGATVDLVDISSPTAQVVVDLEGVYRNPSLTWTTPQVTDPYHTQLQQISCATTTFCMSFDGVGNATTYDGTTWSSPTRALPSASSTPNDPVTVSCPTAAFCVAVDHQGRSATYRSGSWGSPVAIDTAHVLTGVSCATETFCVAVDSTGGALTYDGQQWSARTAVASVMTAISCPSATFCAAISTPGAVLTFDGQTWSAPTSLAASAGLISCVSSTFCLAVDRFTSTGSETFDGAVWTLHPFTSSDTRSLSCAAATFCMVVGGGFATEFDGSSWVDNTQLVDNAEVFGVSCATADHCVAVDDLGGAGVYDNGTWAPEAPAQADNIVDGLSCATATFCVAVDNAGNALTYNGSAWSAPTQVPGVNRLTAVSCPATTFCMALSDTAALTFDGQSWSTPTTLQTLTFESLGSLSCPSATYCVAGDTDGRAYTFDGSTWTGPTLVGSPVAYITSISCPTSSFCADAADGAGERLFDGASWSTPVAATANATSVSCPTAQDCVSAGQSYQRFMYDGTSWHPAPYTIGGADAGYYRSVSCASPSLCVAATDLGSADLFNGATWTPVTNLPALTPVSLGSLTSCPVTGLCVVMTMEGGRTTTGTA